MTLWRKAWTSLQLIRFFLFFLSQSVTEYSYLSRMKNQDTGCTAKVDPYAIRFRASDFFFHLRNGYPTGPNLTAPPIRFSNREKGVNQVKLRITEQVGAEPGTAAVRGIHRCTCSDRCVGLRIQPRCANSVAAPLHSQMTACCRWTRART